MGAGGGCEGQRSAVSGLRGSGPPLALIVPALPPTGGGARPSIALYRGGGGRDNGGLAGFDRTCAGSAWGRVFLTCEQVFVYSAEISNGCIVAYPFLKCYRLQLDAARNCLVDTLAEYSEPTVQRQAETNRMLPPLVDEETPRVGTPTAQWVTWAAAITQTLASFDSRPALFDVILTPS